MKRIFSRSAVALVGALYLGCNHNVTTVLVARKIEEPKVIAIDCPPTPWLAPIEARLRQHGFKVLRWASQRRIRDQVTPTQSEEFNQASTRYVLVIDGSAYLDPMHRCFGGGFKFVYINADLVDTRTNETLVNYSGSGYSEGCPPASGTIFSDIAKAVDSSWQASSQSPIH